MGDPERITTSHASGLRTLLPSPPPRVRARTSVVARLLAVLALVLSALSPARVSWAGFDDGRRSPENRVREIFAPEGEIAPGDLLQPAENAPEILVIVYDYASGSGLFLQRDPEGYRDSVNLYAGFGNDPVNRIDPTGMDSVVVGTDAGSSSGHRHNRSGGKNPTVPATCALRVCEAGLYQTIIQAARCSDGTRYREVVAPWR